MTDSTKHEDLKYLVLTTAMLDSETEDQLIDEINAVFEHHKIEVGISEPVSFEDASDYNDNHVHIGNYVENVLRTESYDMAPIRKRLGDERLAIVLTNAMRTVTEAAEVIDMCKKFVFYGQENFLLDELLTDEDLEFEDLSSDHDNEGHMARLQDEEVIRMLHASVGMATEVGELIDLLHAHIVYGAEFDKVNAVEEIGDSMWYQGVAIDVLGTTLQQVMQTNIDKLRKRFPDKFSEDAAINRDTDAERKVLEGE